MTDLISRLRDTPNWMRESYGSWKDCVLKYDRAPFEAADQIERLTQALKKANDQAEHFEREWYLRGDEIERLRVDAERYRWLRNEGNPYALLVVGKYHATDVRPYYDADLDAAIDAARAALKGADMTPTQRAAAERLADELQRFDGAERESLLDEAAALLRELAAEPVQDEPVAWLKTMYSGTRPILEVDHRKPPATNSIPVYAAPQQPMRCPEDGGECGAGGYCRPEPQQRKPLSDEQIRQIVVEASTGSAIKRDGSTSMRIARAIERAHGITGEPT